MDYQGKDNGAVPVREKISYGLASGGGNIITQILGMFLTSYLTDSVGIAAAAVGTMMLVARFLTGPAISLWEESLTRRRPDGGRHVHGF